MSAPLFQAAARGQKYREPDHELIEREREQVDEGLLPPATVTYEPIEVDDDELARIKEEMRANRVQITPDTVRHALEAEEIRKILRRFGVRSLRKVSGTRDFRGVVKLTFADFRKLVEQLLAEEPSDAD